MKWDMLSNWIHIVIVHVAVLAAPFLACVVFAVRHLPTDAKAWKYIYSALIAVGLMTGIAYFTGPVTAEWTRQVLPTYPQDQVELHAIWGRVGFVIQVFAALLGIMGWASILQDERPHRRLPWVLAVILLMNTAVLLYTAHLGGFIRRMDLIRGMW